MRATTTLTAERLRELVAYDPSTGFFTRRVRAAPNAMAGSVAGSLEKVSGYWQIRIDGRSHQAHRIAWLYVHGKWPEYEIDHRNGIRADNAIANLRDVTRSGNQQNLRKARSHNKSCGLLGVQMTKGKWRAVIGCDNKRFDLGQYVTAESAHEAYVLAKRLLHEGNTL